MNLRKEPKPFQRLQNISYKDHTSNEVCRKIQAGIGEYNELLTLVKKQWKWFGHISRSSGLAKMILQSTVKVKKKKRYTEEEMGKTILKSGQEWTLPAQLGQWRTGQGRKRLLQSHPPCEDMG